MFQAFVGSFAKKTSTGNQAITGVGFKPIAVIFYYGEGTADGTASDDTMGFGVMTASASQSQSGVGQADNRFRRQNNVAITFDNGSGNPVYEASFVSMDSGGFTINWTTADATAEIISYVAIGGSSVTNANVIQVTDSGATGNQSFTGMGFKPSFALYYSNDLAATSNTNFYYWQFGAADGTNTWATSSFSGHAAFANGDSAASTTTQFLRAADIISGQNTFTAATFVSFDSDGLTVNFSAAAGEPASFLGLKGGKYAVGSISQPSSTGNQSVTGLTFEPSLVLFFSVDKVTSTSDTTPYTRTQGATDGTNQFSRWTGNDQTNSKYNIDRAKCIKLFSISATPTLNAEASIVSLDTGGFTINWDTVDSTARQVLYVAMGDIPKGGPQIAMMGVGI